MVDVLAQVVCDSPYIKLYDHGTMATLYTFSTIVFVAQHNRYWSKIIHEEGIFEINSGYLRILRTPKNIISRETWQLEQEKKHRLALKHINDAFLLFNKE